MADYFYTGLNVEAIRIHAGRSFIGPIEIIHLWSRITNQVSMVGPTTTDVSLKSHTLGTGKTLQSKITNQVQLIGGFQQEQHLASRMIPNVSVKSIIDG